MNEPSRELRVVELLGEVLELPGPARHDFVVEATDGDPELRSELEALLAEEEELDDNFLQAPAGTDPSHTPLRPSEGSPRETPERLGPYRVVRRLGRGGMGSVYLGEQKEPVRRQVALKVIDAIHDKASRLRFAAECQALARLNHPNVASMYEVGTTEDERAFVAMELVAGTKITEYCDDHALSVSERLELFTGVCAGVRHAHEKGILHRDIKPSNVLVTEIDHRPTAKVIDFGIARAISEPLIEGPQMTLAHQLIGSPAYMSPEAGSGSRDLDTRTDVYSLGLLLYLLLTGVVPYEDQDGEMFGPVLRRLAREPQPSPSVRFAGLDSNSQEDFASFRRTSIRGLARRLKGDLDAIIDKAIALEREDRYSSPMDLAADLERHLRKVPVSARPRTGPYLIGRFFHRRLGLVASLSALILALTVGTVARTSEARRANLEAARARAALTEAQEVSRFLVELFEIADPERTPEGPIDTRQLLDRAADRLRTELRDQPLIRARLLHTIGTIYTNMAQLEPAEALLREALTIRLRELPPGSPEVTDTRDRLGIVLRRRDRLEEAETLLRENLAAREAATEPDPVAVAEALNSLGNLLWSQRNYEEAEAVHRRALGIRERELPPDHPDLADSLNNLGALLRDLRRYPEAQDVLRRAADKFSRSMGPEHAKRGATLFNLALIEDSTGEWRDALGHAREAAEIWSAAYGADHPRTGNARYQYAIALRRMAHYRQSAAVARELVRTEEEAAEPDPARVARSLNDLALSLGELGDFEAAEAAFRRVLAIRETEDGAEHVRALGARSNLAWLDWRRGRPAAAEAAGRRVVELLEPVVGPDSRTLARALHFQALSLVDQGRDAEALPLLERALEIREASRPPTHPEIGETLMALGLCDQRAGRRPEAERRLRRAAGILLLRLGAEHPLHRQAAEALTAYGADDAH